MKKLLLLIAFVFTCGFQAQAADQYLKLSCETEGAFAAHGSRQIKAQMFLILKNPEGTRKIDVVPLNRDGDEYVRVTPKNSLLYALNENTTLKRGPNSITIRGDADGFFFVSLILTERTGFTKGLVVLEDKGEGSGNQRADVTCTKSK